MSHHLFFSWWDFGSPQFLHVCRKILIAMGGEVVLALDEGLGILGSCQGGTCWKWATTKSFTLIVEICGRFCFIWTNSSRLQDLSCHFRIFHLVFNLLLSQFFFHERVLGGCTCPWAKMTWNDNFFGVPNSRVPGCQEVTLNWRRPCVCSTKKCYFLQAWEGYKSRVSIFFGNSMWL